jgi:hypothetical protein
MVAPQDTHGTVNAMPNSSPAPESQDAARAALTGMLPADASARRRAFSAVLRTLKNKAGRGAH